MMVQLLLYWYVQEIFLGYHLKYRHVDITNSFKISLCIIKFVDFLLIHYLVVYITTIIIEPISFHKRILMKSQPRNSYFYGTLVVLGTKPEASSEWLRKGAIESF